MKKMNRHTWTGEEMKNLRTERGLSMQKFGEHLGLGEYARARISDMEKGRRPISGPLSILLTLMQRGVRY